LELEANYARRSEVESNYAKKSDLESIHPQRSDAGPIPAKRSDAEPIPAKRSDTEPIAAKLSDAEPIPAKRSDAGAIAAKLPDAETISATKPDAKMTPEKPPDAEPMPAKETRPDAMPEKGPDPEPIPDAIPAKESDAESDLPRKASAASGESPRASSFYGDGKPNLLKAGRRTFPLTPGSLKGIINFLTLQGGGNVDDRRMVFITSTPPFNHSASCAAKNIADLEASSFFYCAAMEGMWICYDFGTRKVALAGCSIRSRYNSPAQNLKSWAIDVSIDGSNWTEVDRQENRRELCAQNVVRSFALSKPSTGQYVRLRQIGKNDLNQWNTTISGFELFGTLMF
jgi:hypothetical protein